MAATDQAPEAFAIHQGDAHRRQYAHVLHVLAVDRRHAAQDCPAEVQCLPRVRAQFGDQLYRLIGRVGNDAQPVGAIQLAGLLRDVRCRKEHAVEQLHRRG